MEVLCMFDLPVKTGRDRRNYRLFKKFLDKNGFVMLEESVYCRMVPSGHPLSTLRGQVRENRPPKGMVALLPITEKQFANMEIITGEWKNDVIDTMEAVVEV